MKLFIWNDYSWKLLADRHEDFDRSEFCVVQKLFVQWKMANDEEVPKVEILKYFERYGKIRSVESVNGTKYAEPSEDIFEAYVTFSKSEHAYNAFMAHRQDTMTVLPADTWHQPRNVYNEYAENKCVHECQCWNNFDDNNIVNDLATLAMHDYSSDTFDVIIDPKDMSLEEIRIDLRPMKSRLETLKLHYEMAPEGDLENCISNEQYFKRVTQVVATCIGEKYYEMNIYGVDAITKEMLKSLAPLLRPLKVLTLKSDSNASVIYALSEYCPSLSSLIIEANSWEGECSAVMPKHWPSISTLVIKGTLTIDLDTESGKKFRRFIGINKHLNMLQLDLVANYNLCKAIAKSLKSLRILIIGRETYNGIIQILDLFADSKHLTNISILTLVVDKNDLGRMVNCVRRLRQMKKLKAVTLIQNFDLEPMPREEQFKHLVSLVKFHENCECHAPNRVVSINIDAIDEVNLPRNNKPVVVNIINTKPTTSPEGAIEQANDINGVFKDMLEFYPNTIKTVTLDVGDYCKFINISSA